MTTLIFKPEKLKNFVKCKNIICTHTFKDAYGEDVELFLCERKVDNYIISVNGNWLDSYLYDENYKQSLVDLNEGRIISSFGDVRMTVKELRKTVDYFDKVIDYNKTKSTKIAMEG